MYNACEDVVLCLYLNTEKQKKHKQPPAKAAKKATDQRPLSEIQRNHLEDARKHAISEAAIKQRYGNSTLRATFI